MKPKNYPLLAIAVLYGFVLYFLMPIEARYFLKIYSIILIVTSLVSYIRVGEDTPPLKNIDGILWWLSIFGAGILFGKSFESADISNFWAGMLYIGYSFLTLVLLIIVSWFMPGDNYEPSPMRRLMQYIWRWAQMRRVVLSLLGLACVEWYLYFVNTSPTFNGFMFAVSIWIWVRCTQKYHDLHWIYFEYGNQNQPRTELRVWPIILSGIVMCQYGIFVFGKTGILWIWVIPVVFGFIWKFIISGYGELSFSQHLDEVHSME